MSNNNNPAPFEKVGGRKFVLAVLVLVLAVTLTLVKGQLDPTLAALMIGVIGGFGAGNVMSKRALPPVQASDNSEAKELAARIDALESNGLALVEQQEKILSLVAGKK
jgi:hypothetical protein